MDKEKLISRIMRECEKDDEPVTYEEAAEMAEMEIKAAANGRHYEVSDKPRKSVKKERKIDTTKLMFINQILWGLGEIQDVFIENVKNETEITFAYGNDTFTVRLTRHRPKN